MSKQDLTEYSEDELSLFVMNDECLYRMRREFLRSTNVLDDCFIYTSEQLDILREDIESDLNDE